MLAQLVTETGEVLGSVDGFDRLLSLVPDDSVCWRFVDPYGDAVFNHLQMPAFVAEANHLTTLGVTDGERQSIAGLVELAERCQTGVHLYLKLIGD